MTVDDLREKVISSLETLKQDIPKIISWQYDDQLQNTVGNIELAITLLKAHEPMVMTLEELLNLPKDTPVFIEENNGECGWNVYYGIDEENDVCFCGFKASADYYDTESYGEFWRCWTSRPTDEQREAMSWND